MKKLFPFIIIVLFISGVIYFIEQGKNNTSVTTASGESVTTGIVETDEITGKKIGDVAPNWRLQSFEGDIIELSEFRGTPVMLDYFADWCPFCHEEFPFIEAAHKQYKESVVIIGIHRTDSESMERGEIFARDEAGATFTLVQDVSGDVYGAYTSGPAMPISFFIDREGIIRDKVLGPKTPERLEVAIQTILD